MTKRCGKGRPVWAGKVLLSSSVFSVSLLSLFFMFTMFSGSTREGSVITGDLGTKPIEHVHKTLKDRTIRRFMMVVLVTGTI